MTALEALTARGLSASDAQQYLAQAEDRVRLYLNYGPDDDLSRFSLVIADIASDLYDKQTAVTAAKTAYIANAGLTGKSYSEGPVSVHENYAAADSGWASVGDAYEKQIQGSLNILARYRRVRVVTC